MTPTAATVVLTVHREGAVQLHWCLSRLRAVYSTVPVIVISDGVVDPAYEDCCRRFEAEYYLSQRLKTLQCGAAWWKRFFSIAVRVAKNRQTPHLLKIDPDTSFNRPFAKWPTADFFGSLLREPAVQGGPPVLKHVQGGCQGFSQAFAKKILDSGVCDDIAYADTRTWCPVPAAAKEFMLKKYLSTDWTMVHIASRLGATWADWPEVRCRWRPWSGVLDTKWAVTHPYRLSNEPAADSSDVPPSDRGSAPGLTH